MSTFSIVFQEGSIVSHGVSLEQRLFKPIPKSPKPSEWPLPEERFPESCSAMLGYNNVIEEIGYKLA